MACLIPSTIPIILLFTITAIFAGQSSAGAIQDAIAPFAVGGHHYDLPSSMTCGETACFEDESDDFAASRRELLAGRRRFLSYNMLKKNRVPCNVRGASYYNCNRHGRANPYHRGCSFITKCARDLH